MHNQRSQAHRLFSLFAVFLSVAALCGCSASHSEGPHQPMVAALQSHPSLTAHVDTVATRKLGELKAQHTEAFLPEDQAAAATSSPAPASPQVSSTAIDAEVTLRKSEILNRDFLYSADLQYSSIGDVAHSLLIQSLAMGIQPARMTIVGDHLQLIADQTRLFESDINHPGLLLHGFPIVRQDADTVTIVVNQASPTLATSGKSNWVRSVEFVPQGDYLLMETSVQQSDGSIAEVMESLFPRDTLVPKDAKPILATPELNPAAARFRFISGDEIFVNLPEGRRRAEIASHFNITPDAGVIEWYVTPNVPAKYLPILKAGVEGWNRYSQKMWNRDFIKFSGVLPAGVKLGDPRYNVINWDSIPQAGAAYESQATDPLSGIQSHSLIYLPYAWVKIGEEYWKDGVSGNIEDGTPKMGSTALNGLNVLGRTLHLDCENNFEFAASLSARLSPEAFANELLKGVLFHEVGHALGLAHNFKGSLSWNPNDPKSLFSSSVMDYNQYQLESTAFKSEASSDGPLFEYDRQILSAIYNDGKDIAANDPVLPACNDREADDMSAGVDPTCLRYDSGEDPSLELSRTIALTKDPAAKLGPLRSLPAALGLLTSELKNPGAAATENDAKLELIHMTQLTAGVLKYYLATGAQSLRYAMVADVKSLYEFREGVTLPGGDKADKGAYLGRVIDGLNYVNRLETLEPAALDGIKKIALGSAKWLKSTAWYANEKGDKDAKARAMLAPLLSLPKAVDASLLPSIRAKVLLTLVRHEETPFYFSANEAPIRDVEKLVLDLLENALTEPLGAELRPFQERIVAAQSLTTFKGTLGGNAALARAHASLDLEQAHAKSSMERTALRKMTAILDTASTGASMARK